MLRCCSNEFQNSNFKIKYTIPEMRVNIEKINPIKVAILIGVFELLIIPTSAISNKVKKLFLCNQIFFFFCLNLTISTSNPKSENQFLFHKDIGHLFF